MRFIDRHLERSALADAWASGRPELVVVHGRRRVGKGELLSRWAAGKSVQPQRPEARVALAQAPTT